MKRTVAYLGLLDDFALRHQLTGACPADVRVLNNILLTQSFVGPPLIVNDGYFVMHPAVQRAIIDPEQSPLCALTEGSFLTVLTRNQGRLENLAEDMGGKDITTGRKLSESHFYKNEFKPKLEVWASTLRSPACNAFQSWPPPNMDECFFRTLKMGFNNYLIHQPKERVTAAQEFWDEFISSSKKRRTEWEDIAEARLQNGGIEGVLFNEMMALGNQAYQYSWATALTKYRDDLIVRVDTNASALFLDLHETPELTSEAPLPRVELTIPALNTSYAEKHVNGRWQLVTQMLQDGHEVNIAKHEFMDRLSEYPMGLCTPKDMSDASRNYSAQLSSHFKGASLWLPLTFDLTALTGSTGVGLAVGGPVGAAVGFGIGLLGVGAAHGWPGPKIFSWAATPNQKNWFNDLQITYVDGATTTLAVNAKKARDHLAGVTEYTG